MQLRSLAHAITVRTAMLALGWWAISEGAPTGVIFGALVVAIASAVSIATSAPSALRVRLVGLLRLGGFFIAGSLRGGVDVARRALSPSPGLSPTLIRYRSTLPEGGLRQLFMSMISLMPGTQSVDTEGADVWVHVLVQRDEKVARDLGALEARVEAAFARMR